MMSDTAPSQCESEPWILVVDDDETLCELIIRSLGRHGHAVQGVGSGEEAIERIADAPTRLIILDYRLPDMTGKELIQALAERGLDVPFIMMTGHGDERLAVDLMKLGAADYLVKDTELLDRLPPVIQRVLQTIEMKHRLRKAEEEKERLQKVLEQAQKMESVGRLAGGVAHDFNNMLIVILGNVELLQENPAVNQIGHAELEEIRKAAQRSADLTRQLLAFARKQTVAPKVLDLNRTVEESLKILARLIGEDIHLVWAPAAPLDPILMDPAQLDQILTNLCINARDAIADTGTITIKTAAASFDEAYCAKHAGFAPGDYAMIAISDDGCGMDAETLGHLFEPFFTTKDVGKGTGLGLATVYGAVRQNNGFIHVESELGIGTTFSVYLPRHKATATIAADAKEHEKTPASAPAGGATILLVEDELAILRMITVLLKHMGHNVIAAGTPGEAIQIAKEHSGHIDLLITDVVMPEMNGRDLAQKLTSIHPGMKRLFMSGYTSDVIAHHGVLDEGMHFIQKPFNRNSLAAGVQAALDEEVQHPPIQ